MTQIRMSVQKDLIILMYLAKKSQGHKCIVILYITAFHRCILDGRNVGVCKNRIHNRRMVELFESLNPHVVTRKQYEQIVTAQRQKKLEFEFNLGYVIEERFYTIKPQEARKQVEKAQIIKFSLELFLKPTARFSLRLLRKLEVCT